MAQIGEARSIASEDITADLFREVLQRFGRARLRVQGMSMIPSIWPGDVVEIVRTDPGSLCEGDIVLLQRDERLLCHRICRLDGQSVRTRGDYLQADDPALPLSAILGCVSTPLPKPRLAAAVLRGLAHLSQRPLAWCIRRRVRPSPP